MNENNCEQMSKIFSNDNWVYVDKLLNIAEKYSDDANLHANKNPTLFLQRKDTKEFIEALKEIDNLKDEDIVQGRGKDKKFNKILAIKYCTWISVRFQVFVYSFILDRFHLTKELGGDKFKEFKNEFFKTHSGDDGKLIIPDLSMYINLISCEKGKDRLKFVNYVYKNMTDDIKMGEKITLVGLKINVDYYSKKFNKTCYRTGQMH